MTHRIMRAARHMGCLAIALLLAQLAAAQATETPAENAEEVLFLDDFTERHTTAEKPILDYQPVREADILWEKRIWRVVDVREKMNQHFISPNALFFQILAEAAVKGDLPVFSSENDRFTKRLSTDDVIGMITRIDTIWVDDLDGTGAGELRIVRNEINWEDVKRYRIKEAVFFDTKTGTLRTRILGIAPVIDVLDDEGNFRYEMPMFWVHYPTARPFFARQQVYLPGDNLAAATTWDDIFEMRRFSSYIYKENNQQDRRLQDYLTGVDLLMESDKINDELFNREHDLWAW